MRRVVGSGYGAVIEAAHAVIPSRVLDLIQPEYFCGADPILAGLHGFADASYGRSYRITAHVTYPFHQTKLRRPDRRTTVVLPVPIERDAVVHELGHVLDERLGFSFAAEPVSWYAKVNRMEAFAEAFTSWLVPGYAADIDRSTRAFLDSLT